MYGIEIMVPFEVSFRKSLLNVLALTIFFCLHFLGVPKHEHYRASTT